ncbi:hypothetical protein BS78_K331400 [Paspalum vaginatum]|uniref:Uncharacterized protein n=1 Tax=Paspalum vaginatum TaxID=158149 RepID=A0A9W7X7K6_9POAL|nr:hypothetical protein BS78_K331400 [Paspalum vaginatum]
MSRIGHPEFLTHCVRLRNRKKTKLETPRKRDELFGSVAQSPRAPRRQLRQAWWPNDGSKRPVLLALWVGMARWPLRCHRPWCPRWTLGLNRIKTGSKLLPAACCRRRGAHGHCAREQQPLVQAGPGGAVDLFVSASTSDEEKA